MGLKSSRVLSVMLAITVAMFAVGCNDDDDGLGDGHDFGDNDPNLHTAVGDSITESGWPSILASMLGKPVNNRGSGGSTTSDGVRQANSALSKDKPGYLLIQYGANDVIHGFDTDHSVENLRAIVRSAKGNKSIPVVATLTPMTDSYRGFATAAQRLSDGIRSMASQEGAGLADCEDAFGSGAGLLRDGLHPNDAGKQEIAAVFLDVLN